MSIMDEFMNQNTGNPEDSTNTDRTAAAGEHTESATSNTGTTGQYHADYRSGYYRNTSPHQDEPIGRTSASSDTNRYNSYQTNGYTNQTGTENGYNYVNYYPGNGQNSEPPKKKKGNHKKALRVTAFVTAMVLVIGASFTGGYLVNRSNSVATGSSNATGEASTQAQTSDDSSKDDDTDSAQGTSTAATDAATPSWLELSQRSDSISIPEIVEKITPSVVGVQSTFTIEQQSTSYGGYGGFFGYGGFGNQDSGQTQTQQAVGTGTGVIMSEEGYIVTNAHVIYDSDDGYGLADSVVVQLSDQTTECDAEIVAYDIESDLAVLKIDHDGLQAAEFGDSDECKVGEMVVAIGNPLGLELQNTVTCGIISALNREVTINDKQMTLIQTDTAINNGNSGGPLINSAGQVIGINSAKMSSSYYSSDTATIEGIGFAIPITEAKDIVNDLITYGYVTGRPQLGITCQDVSEAISQAYNLPVGAYIISITEGGAADKAGLQIQDVITAIDGQEITSTEELNNYKNEHDAGDEVVLTVVRAGQSMDIPVVLEEAVSTQ
jgi:serine protease Do